MRHKPLNLKEAADWLHIHENTAQALAAEGILPGVKHGKEWTFLEIDLVRYHRAQVRRAQRERQAQSESPAPTPKRAPIDGQSPRSAPRRKTPPSLDRLEAQGNA